MTANTEHMPNTRLLSLRADIDEVDAQLVALLARRFSLTDEVGALKKKHKLPAVDEARESSQMARIEKLAELQGLDPALAKKFLRVVIDEVVARHKLL